MASAQHKYPIGKGMLKTFTRKEFDELKFFSFGMYHAIVNNPDYRLFKVNNNNWYTHTDLNYAKNKLNLTITINYTILTILKNLRQSFSLSAYPEANPYLS
jgi:hypothetical protein